MSTNPTDTLSTILNHSGGKLITRTGSKRLHRTSICFRGTEIDIQYLTDGEYLSATDVDPASYPVCLIKVVEVGGVDVTKLLEERMDEISERVEAMWRGEL